MLRRDVLEWLQRKFDIDVANDLVYLDGIKMYFDDFRFSENMRVALDRHRARNERITCHMPEIIDHREITCRFPPGQLETESIQTVSSCSTLVAQCVLTDRSLPQLETLLRLLYGAILLDTDCLGLSNNQTTKMDIGVSSEIDQLLSLSKDQRFEIDQKEDNFHVTSEKINFYSPQPYHRPHLQGAAAANSQTFLSYEVH